VTVAEIAYILVEDEKRIKKNLRFLKKMGLVECFFKPLKNLN